MYNLVPIWYFVMQTNINVPHYLSILAMTFIQNSVSCAINYMMIHDKVCTSFCLQVLGTKVIFIKSFRLLFMLPCYSRFFLQFLSPHSSESYTFLASVCLSSVALWIPSLSTLISISHFTLYGDLLLELLLSLNMLNHLHVIDHCLLPLINFWNWNKFVLSFEARKKYHTNHTNPYLNFTQCELLFRSQCTALPSSGPWLT